MENEHIFDFYLIFYSFSMILLLALYEGRGYSYDVLIHSCIPPLNVQELWKKYDHFSRAHFTKLVYSVVHKTSNQDDINTYKF